MNPQLNRRQKFWVLEQMNVLARESPGRVKVPGKPLTPNMCGPSLMQKETLPSQQHPKNVSFFSDTLFSQDSQQRAYHAILKVLPFFQSFNCKEQKAKRDQEIFTTHFSHKKFRTES